MELADNLRTFLESGDDWEKKVTSIKGVSILKLPNTKTRSASLAIEINPPNETGMPMKRKGLILTGSNELQAFRDIFENEKIDVLFAALEEVIPGRGQNKKKDEDILQI